MFLTRRGERESTVIELLLYDCRERCSLSLPLVEFVFRVFSHRVEFCQNRGIEAFLQMLPVFPLREFRSGGVGLHRIRSTVIIMT